MFLTNFLKIQITPYSKLRIGSERVAVSITICAVLRTLSYKVYHFINIMSSEIKSQY